MLSVDDLNTYYGDSHVLQGVSLHVLPGELVALLGRNGAGKTTTINAIIGFVPSRRGRIRVANARVRGWPGHGIARLGAGLVPQGRGLFSTLPVREKVVLAARPHAGGAWTLDRVLSVFPRLAARLQHL